MLSVKMKIYETNNRLIAEFMGHTFADYDLGGLHYLIDGNYVEYNSLQYDASWDWLIPVVNKIEMECEGVPLQLLNCNLYSEIGEVYQAIVEFIKEHNDER